MSAEPIGAPQKSRLQLIVSSVLLATWIAMLAWFALGR